jgi:hypothetical protein
VSTALTGVLKEIADIAGAPAAIALAVQVGGTRIYIPSKVGDRHWLVQCVGRRAADAICAHFAVDGKRGTRVDIPLGGGGAYPQLKRAIARRVHQLDQENKSARDIARETGLSQRGVHRHRAAHRGGRKDDKQGSLF